MTAGKAPLSRCRAAYFAILLIGFLLWLSYGAAARNLGLLVPNAVALLIGASTIAVALHLGRPARRGR